MMMRGKGGSMKSRKGMMKGGKGHHGKGGKGSFGKGLQVTSKHNHIMVIHHLDESNDDNGLETLLDLITGTTP